MIFGDIVFMHVFMLFIEVVNECIFFYSNTCESCKMVAVQGSWNGFMICQ